MHLFRSFSSLAHRPLLGGLLALFVAASCQTEEPPSSYVARVGSHYLTDDDLTRMLADMGPTPDSVEARRQVIEQWVTQTLLYREAQRRNLAATEQVQRRLERQRRSVLVAALKTRFHNEADYAPSSQEVRTYYERHKEQLRLREPYVRIRYLATDTDSAVQTIQRALRTGAAASDSSWTRLVRTHAADTAEAKRFSNYSLPEGQVTQALPFSSETLTALDAGDTAPVVERNGQFHVLHLNARIPAGTIPELDWYKPKIRRRLQIRARKQMYAREVQRLRNEAQAQDALETP